MEKGGEALRGAGWEAEVEKEESAESSTAWESLAKGGMESSISDASWHIHHPSCCGEALCALASSRGFSLRSSKC